MSRVPPFNDKQTWLHNEDYECSKIFDFNNTCTVPSQLHSNDEIYLTSRLQLQNQPALGIARIPKYLCNQFHPRSDESTRFKHCIRSGGYTRNELHPKLSAGHLNVSLQDTSHWYKYQPRTELGHSDVESRWNHFNEERRNPDFGPSSMKWHDYRNRNTLLPVMMSEEITPSEELDRNAHALNQHWQMNQLKTRRQHLESKVYMESDEPFSTHFSRLADQRNSDGMECGIQHRGRSFKGHQPSGTTVPTDDRTYVTNQSNIELQVPENANLSHYLSYINCNRVISREQNQSLSKFNDRGHILECLDKVSPKTVYHNDGIASILNQNFDSDLVDFAKDEITRCIEQSQILHGVAKQSGSRVAIMIPDQGTSTSYDRDKQRHEMRGRLPTTQHPYQDTRIDKQHIAMPSNLQICSITQQENHSKNRNCSEIQLPTSCDKASSVKITKRLKETGFNYLSSIAKVHRTQLVNSGSVIPRTLHIVTPTTKPMANNEPESSHNNNFDKSTEEYEAALVLQCLHESVTNTKVELDHSTMINDRGSLLYLNATSIPNDGDINESRFKQPLIKEEVPAVQKRKRGRPPKTQLDPWSRLQLDTGENGCLPELKDRVPPWEILVPHDSMFGQIEDRDELYMADDEEHDEFWKFRSLHGPTTDLAMSLCAKVRSLVDPSFDGLFVAMAQMIPCKLTVGDQNCGIISYKSLPIGFNGLACRHCGGRAGSGRYFPSTVRCLSQTTTAQNMIKHFINASVIVPDEADLQNSNEKTNHVDDSIDAISSPKSGKAYCTNCPHSVWLWLTEFQKRLIEDKDTLRNQNDIGCSHKGSSHRVKYGARKVFYAKVWKRIHKTAYDDN